jgi:hypothetical protein
MAVAAATAEAEAAAAGGKPELCFETSAIYWRQLAVGERFRWTWRKDEKHEKVWILGICTLDKK